MTKTAFKTALRRGDIASIELALETGTNVNDPVDRDDTPIHKAVLSKNLLLAKLLLSRGANANAIDSKKRTALDIATELKIDELKCLIRENGGLILQEVIAQRKKSLQGQEWSGSLSAQAIKALAEDGILTREVFLTKTLSWDHPFKARNEVGDLQRKMKIELGLLDPAEPVPDDKIGAHILTGGLFYRHGKAHYSFGDRHVKKMTDRFMCLRGGHIFFLPKNSITKSDRAFNTQHCRFMLKVGRAYGVYVMGDNRQWDYNLDKTREVFGIDLISLEIVVQAYANIFREEPPQVDLRMFGLGIHGSQPRVTCSNSENSCDMTGNYIPSEMPYIAFENSQDWLGHISLGAFLDALSFITEDFNPKRRVTRMLAEGGFSQEILECLKRRDRPFYAHVSIADVHDYYQ